MNDVSTKCIRCGLFTLLVLIAMQLFRTGAFAAGLSGAHNTPLHQQALRDLTQLADDAMGGRKPGTSGHHAAQQYLHRRFTELALEPLTDDYRQPFCYTPDVSKTCGVNISGLIRGTRHPQTYLVITAHYDHLGTRGGLVFNGADDNASGVAVMLAVASAFTARPPRHSVIFLATDAEEAGLYGSKHWVKNAPVPLSQVKLNLNLDMLAHGGRSQRAFILTPRRNNLLREWLGQFKGDLPHARIAISPARLYRSDARYLARPSWRKASDHASFLAMGIDSIFMAGDTHARYHTPSDSVANIRQAFFLSNVDIALALSRRLDDALPTITFP